MPPHLRRCGSPALRREPFCYYHHPPRPPKSREQPEFFSRFDLPMPEDRSAIQALIGLILQRIATGCLDSKRAGLLLYGLQIASSNLPKDPQKPIESVEEVTEDPEFGLLAPESEIDADEVEVVQVDEARLGRGPRPRRSRGRQTCRPCIGRHPARSRMVAKTSPKNPGHRSRTTSGQIRLDPSIGGDRG